MQQDQRRGRRGGLETSVRSFAVWAAVQDVIARRQSVLAREVEGDRPSGGGLDDRSPLPALRVIDLGGGTGELAVPLAELGHAVTVVDPSPDALAALVRRADDAGVGDRIAAVQGDTDTLPELHPDSDVDLVCCHGVLEFTADPRASLQSIGSVLAPGGYLSLVVTQRLAAVIAKALSGQFAQALQALRSEDGRWGSADPLPRRFDAGGTADLVRSAGLVVEDSHGVRIFSDLVPSSHLDTEAERTALLELEREASRQGEVLGQLGAALHVLARRER